MTTTPSAAGGASRMAVLRHALGLRNPGDRPFRNHFVTGPGSSDFDDCEALVAEGLMTKRAGNALTGGDPCYCATAAGIASATGASQ